MSEYDHEALGDAIVRRLSELYVEEKHRAHINTRGGSRASPSAAFLATDADIPNLKKDPVKNMRPSCRICGKTGHSESACFHNEGATCPVAIGRAPLGTALHRKHNANASGSQPPPRNGGRRKSTSSGSARALAASSSTTSERKCEQALADTLGRCGLLAEDCGGRALMAITVSPDHLAARGISHTVATPTSSLMKKSTATYGIIDHLAEQQPLLGDLIQPYAARIMRAIRKSPSPLTASMRPINTARYSLAKATSICQRIHGHLRPIPSRRDALSSDDILTGGLDVRRPL